MELTQAELAEKCNLSLRTIQRIEALEVTPRNYTVRAILSCLGYVPDELSKDSSVEDTGKRNRKKRTGRPFKYVQELFNLKHNTMKKLSVLSLFAALLFAGIFFANTSLSAQKKGMKATSESLVGVWQQIVIDHKTNTIQAYIPFLKIINSDGTYVHIQMLGGAPAFFNAAGKWKVTSDTTFLEYVEPSYGKPARTEEQTFKIEKYDFGTFMHSRFHTVGTKMEDIEEVWQKIDYYKESPKK